EIEIAKISKERETELAAKEQAFKTRMAALDRAIDPNRAPADRKMVLRFLKAAAGDPAVEKWAGDELQVVQDEMDSLKMEKGDLEKELSVRKSREADLEKTLAQKGHSARENFKLG